MRALGAALAALLLPPAALAASGAVLCQQDLEAIPAFLLANDAGARDQLERAGQAYFAAAMTQARHEAAAATDDTQCLAALNAYLKAWRKGHLSVTTAAASASTPPRVTPAPQLQVLSAHSLLLRLPSFAGRYRDSLRELLKQQRRALDSHRYWIIDVRGNGGGNDDVFYLLLPALMSNDYARIGAAWLATPANIEALQQACARFAPGDAQCVHFMSEAVERMRSVASGSYVSQEEGSALRYVEAGRVPHRPARVAVLMDRRCGSSCEEFLLTVRQSFSVKLVGTPSAGSLDYSNLQPHALPSGKRVLMYATSRSYRLPGLPVDAAGVQPDIYLPDSTAASSQGAGASDPLILRVQRWLEGGSLAADSERKQE